MVNVATMPAPNPAAAWSYESQNENDLIAVISLLTAPWLPKKLFGMTLVGQGEASNQDLGVTQSAK